MLIWLPTNLMSADHSGTDHTCPVDAQGSDGEKHTSNSEWRIAEGVSHGKEDQEISWI